MTTLERVNKEIVDLHDFFVEWFNGTACRDQLEPRFLSRLHDNLVFIPPEGEIITGPMLRSSFEKSFGTNAQFRIQIRDVTVRHEIGNVVLATYTEWQIGSTQSENENARLTTVLMDLGTPVAWLHIQETWLPASVKAAGSFDF